MNESHGPSLSGPSGTSPLAWTLRIGVAGCFIGHGTFGLLTKAAWLPYFAVGGIPEPAAWRLMPLIGAMDVALGLLALLWPCRALFGWAVLWTLWTALLRPFAGEGWPEFFERAGNYGVPLALLAAAGLQASWWSRLPDPRPTLDRAARRRLEIVLRLVTFTLLAGHAGCALLLRKASLCHNYAIFSPAPAETLMIAAGGVDLLLALAVVVFPSPALLAGIALWKFFCESLFLASGVPAPIFEVIERFGSYTAPLALALLLRAQRRAGPAAALRSLQPA